MPFAEGTSRRWQCFGRHRRQRTRHPFPRTNRRHPGESVGIRHPAASPEPHSMPSERSEIRECATHLRRTRKPETICFRTTKCRHFQLWLAARRR
ncbi:hypothetical protein BN1095_2860002 [Clostridioides difficile]|uniref:Uncharacterized protein n=1 Tax=Clostridioides difficile TaxID=1496 RepID=A0A069ALX1_CLODI|nr:hypothetical protein BN1095_2860002 [Clostridioides difficile]